MHQELLDSVPLDDATAALGLDELQQGYYYVRTNPCGGNYITMVDIPLERFQKIWKGSNCKFYVLQRVTDYICCELAEGQPTFHHKFCNHCQDYVHQDTLHRTDHDGDICEGCVELHRTIEEDEKHYRTRD